MIDFRWQFLCPALFLLLLLTTVPLALAQGPSAQQLNDLETALATDESLSDERRGKLQTQLNSARELLDSADQFRRRAAEYTGRMENAPGRAAALERQLAQAQASPLDPESVAPEGASVAELESQLTLLLAERQSLNQRRNELLAEVDELPARRTEAQQRLVKLQNQGEPVPRLPAGTERSLEQQVALSLSLARQAAIAAETEALEAEILSEPARSEVSAEERSWLGFAIGLTEAKLAVLEEAVERARASATEEQLATTSQLQEQLQNQAPLLEGFAAGNRSLAEQLQQFAEETEAARSEGMLLGAQLDGIKQDSLLMHRRLEVAGRKEVLGRVMMTRMDSLPDTAELKREIEKRNQLIADTSLAQIDIEEDFRALNNRNQYMAQLLPDWDSRSDSSRELVLGLVDQRAELLEENLRSSGALLSQLLDNNDTARELVSSTRKFNQFLQGNLLWVRNFSFLSLPTLYRQLSVLLAPEHWAAIPRQLASGYRNLDWSALLLLILALAIALRWRLRPAYAELLKQPVLLSATTLWNIIAGLLLSLLLVLPWPLALLVVGRFLDAADEGSQFSAALAAALTFSAYSLYALLLIRLIANRKGAGRRHLKWDGRMLDSLRTELNWAGPVILLASLLDVFAYNLDPAASGGPLGALANAALAASLIALAIRLLLQDSFAETTTLKMALQMIALVGSLVIVMQMVGLLFAAEIYLLCLVRSILALLLIKIVADVFERWLLILRARLERRTRDSHRLQEEVCEEEPEGDLDLMSLSEAHSKLLSLARIVATAVALWLIWSPSLPALTLLDSITLWHVSDAASPTAERAITLFDFALSALILVITALVTRHLPSLSEVFMREWFNMSHGARYATTILMQYMVIAIGGSLFLSTVGWEWGKVQWLVAALGVGIGFGLQEIVANFISGIIILFERPVRVGDIISAGGAEGVVKKINPRATIIETFERKEHLIPNKELITGQVINWSLTESAVRVVIPVGIAYGSDVRRAMALLLEAAAEEPRVLDEPEPRATFEDFGDNALVLWLRCYVAEDRPGVWTELRTQINDKFNEAGIVISFPQRDIHLDTPEPLRIEISGRGD